MEFGEKRFLGRCHPGRRHEAKYPCRYRRLLLRSGIIHQTQSALEARHHLLRPTRQWQNHLYQSHDEYPLQSKTHINPHPLRAQSQKRKQPSPSNPPLFPSQLTQQQQQIFGPERSIDSIFTHARREAPCYLVFEDLDSLVTDQVRSYFLNEVDGLKSNDGILMLGSTNHLDRLDPGIAKRPSRFDRKYLFSNPDTNQREAYCHFWQKKLEDNPDVDFPDRLCAPIAAITHGFSFAYMQEAFVASLLAVSFFFSFFFFQSPPPPPIHLPSSSPFLRRPEI